MGKLKVLIPTDFSVQAEYAYLMVKNLRQEMPLDIHFLHVLVVPDTVTLSPEGNIQTCGEIDITYINNQKIIAERNLNSLVSTYGAEISTHLVLGKIAEAIPEFAEGNQFDLIVMGTKGAWGIKETLSGSATQVIANRSSVPVLSLMCDRSALKLQHLLLVHKFSHPAKENLSLIQQLIRAFNPKIHLLQVNTANSPEPDDLIKKNMIEFARLNEISNFDCHILQDKDVENGVIHFNQMMETDLVCIGTHGKRGIFHHSATGKLINHLFKPILTFHLK